MNIKKLLNDDGAVSPVIGVILMVAITVILAAVIATFVLGLGEQISESSPNASFTFDYNESGSSTDFNNQGPQNGSLSITHAGGPNIDSTQMSVIGSSVDDGGTWNDGGISGDVSAGDSVSITVASDDTISVVWENQDGTESATLQRFEVP